MFGDVGLQESHHSEGQLRVNKDVIIAALADTHKMLADYCWKSQDGHKGLEGELSLAPLQVLKEALIVMKLNYIHLPLDRDHCLQLNEIRLDALRRKKEEVDNLCLELSLRHSSSSKSGIQSSIAATFREQQLYMKSRYIDEEFVGLRYKVLRKEDKGITCNRGTEVMTGV